MATISTHNGSSVSRGHNLRDERCIKKDEHIDLTKPHEIWFDEAPRKAYERIFGQSVRDYNEKQTREDRKIDDYYNKICNDGKKKPVYEMIIGIYPADNEQITEQTQKEIMHEFVDTWHQRNPNLELVGAYYHADEPGKAPHVHIDYVPVSRGNKRGMETQNGLDKALRQQGHSPVSKSVTPQIQWEKRENEVLESLCNKRGFHVEHPQEGKGVEHLHTELYKAKKDLEKANGQLEAIKNSITVAEEQIKEKENELYRADIELSFKQKKAENIENRVFQLAEQRDAAMIEVLNLGKQKEQLESDVTSLATQKTALESNIKALKIHKNQWDEIIEEKQTEAFGLNYELQEAKKQLQELRGQFQQQKTSYERNVAVIREQKRSIETNEATIQEQKSTISKLEVQVKTLLEPFKRILSEFFKTLGFADRVMEKNNVEMAVGMVELARDEAMKDMNEPLERGGLPEGEVKDLAQSTVKETSEQKIEQFTRPRRRR